MGYNTDYIGTMKFKDELTARQLAHLNKLLGEDVRDVDPDSARNVDFYYIDLELTDEYDGIKWTGAEKTYGMDEQLNYVMGYMKKEWPEFELEGTFDCQGDECGDVYKIVIEDGLAVIKEVILEGKKIKCPHCDEQFILQDEHVEEE